MNAAVSRAVSTPRAHEHEDALGVRIAEVVEETVRAPCDDGKSRHGLRDDGGHLRIERRHRLAGLKEDVRVLRGASHERAIGRERTCAVSEDELVVDERAEIIVREHRDLVDLVRGAKAVEEMDDWNAGPKCRGMCDRREVVGFLDRVAREEGKARGAHGHDVGVIAEDTERLRRERPRRDVDHGGSELARDLVHVGNHQEEAL